jgi:hypothetical protein
VKAFGTTAHATALLLDQRWSAKIKYQIVDFGTETVRITALTPFLGTALAVSTQPFAINFMLASD